MNGQSQLEPCALAVARADGDMSAMRADDFGDDREPEAATAGVAGASLIKSDEPIKHPLTIGCWDSGAIVGDLQNRVARFRPQPQADLAGGVPGGVVGEIPQHPGQLSTITTNPYRHRVHPDPRRRALAQPRRFTLDQLIEINIIAVRG